MPPGGFSPWRKKTIVSTPVDTGVGEGAEVGEGAGCWPMAFRLKTNASIAMV
jgi:hypothetical protein